jgi:hypothetical protein
MLNLYFEAARLLFFRSADTTISRHAGFLGVLAYRARFGLDLNSGFIKTVIFKTISDILLFPFSAAAVSLVFNRLCI